MARGYIFNKNLISSWDYRNRVKCEKLLAVLIGKTIQSRMYLVFENKIFAVDRLIDEDRSTEDTVIFKLEVSVYSYDFDPKFFQKEFLKDYEIFRYIGSDKIRYISKFGPCGDEYFGFISPGRPDDIIIPGLRVKISSFHITEKPIDYLEAFEVSPVLTNFIPANDLDLAPKYVLTHMYFNSAKSVYLYMENGKFEEVHNISPDWYYDERTETLRLRRDSSNPSSQTIRIFTSKEEATIEYFKYCTSDLQDTNLTIFGRPCIGKLITGSNGTIYIYDQNNEATSYDF